MVVWVPAVVVFAQAQMKGIGSEGVVLFQKNSGRVPGQAGPAYDVSVDLPSVRVTIPLKAGFCCIYLAVFPLEFLWTVASMNVGEVLVGHTGSSIQTMAV